MIFNLYVTKPKFKRIKLIYFEFYLYIIFIIYHVIYLKKKNEKIRSSLALIIIKLAQNIISDNEFNILIAYDYNWHVKKERKIFCNVKMFIRMYVPELFDR